MKLLEMIDDYFYELLLEEELRNNNEYQKLIEENEDIFNQHPAIEELFNEKKTTLSKSDASAFNKWFSNQNYQSMIKMKAYYFKGMKDLLELLEKIKK